MADLIDLEEERRLRAPPCTECGGSEPASREMTWRDVGMDTWLGLRQDDPEAGWTQDPEAGPRVLGALAEEKDA